MNPVRTAFFLVIVTTSALAGAVQAKSLWTEDSPMNNLLMANNANQVGDILTILVQEDHRANDTADGEGTRTQQGKGILSMIFNNRFMQKVFGGASQAPELSWSTSNQFQGETEVDRSSRFNSRLSATIVRIDQAGNFLIEARKTIRIGEEHKSIILSGKVRPRDIINNSVQSFQIADAEISYMGEGSISKMANPTLFQKFFNFLF